MDEEKKVPIFTELECIKHLSARIDTKKYPFQMPNAFIYKWECDYWVMDQNGITREFEVKISRADYFNDSKKQKHTGIDGANYFYYVVPRWLITANEVDRRYGLIYIRDGGFIEFIKRPSKLHDNRFTDWKMLASKMFWRFRTLWREKYISKEISHQEYVEGLLLDEFETEEMCSCGKHKAEPMHACPYRADVNNDSETLCNCCDYCRNNCADDV